MLGAAADLESHQLSQRDLRGRFIGSGRPKNGPVVPSAAAKIGLDELAAIIDATRGEAGYPDATIDKGEALLREFLDMDFDDTTSQGNPHEVVSSWGETERTMPSIETRW